MTARWLAIVSIAALGASFASAALADAPPGNLLAQKPSQAVDPVLGQFKFDKLRCAFSEEKKIALLAKPLKSSGTIYFARDKGVARMTTLPKPQQLVVTKTALRIKKGDKTEEIPLDKSKDLKAFALIFPTLLRGDRTELARSFELSLYGSDKDWWALTFTPKADSLKKLVKNVVVFGKKTEVVSLRVAEANGDTTDTQLSDFKKNGDVPDAEIATAFGAN